MSKFFRRDAGLDLSIKNVLQYDGTTIFNANNKDNAIVLNFGAHVVFDTGIHIDLPAGTVGLLFPRSSTSLRGILIHTGVIDSGYLGSIKIVATCLKNGVEIEIGQRIAQLVILPLYAYKEIVQLPLSELPAPKEGERGFKGFGSTGK